MPVSMKGHLKLRRGHNSYKKEHNLSKVKRRKERFFIYVQDSEKHKGNKELELWKLAISTNVSLLEELQWKNEKWGLKLYGIKQCMCDKMEAGGEGSD